MLKIKIYEFLGCAVQPFLVLTRNILCSQAFSYSEIGRVLQAAAGVKYKNSRFSNEGYTTAILTPFRCNRAIIVNGALPALLN